MALPYLFSLSPYTWLQQQFPVPPRGSGKIDPPGGLVGEHGLSLAEVLIALTLSIQLLQDDDGDDVILRNVS